MSARRWERILPALALIMPFLSSWPATAQDLEPAEFRVAGPGTRLTFDDFGCTVAAGGGDSFDCLTVPTGDIQQARLSFVSHAAFEGKVVRLGFMRTMLTGDINFKSVGLPPESRAALQQLWPLAVGNSVGFRMDATLTHRHTGYWGTERTVHPTLRAVASVVGTDSIELSQGRFPVYVIETDVPEFHIPGYTRAGIRWTWWYAPDLGVAVKIRTEWTRGPASGQSSESELWHADILGN